MTVRVILFDIDLTLVETGGAGLKSLAFALNEMVGDAEACMDISFAGKTDPLIFEEIASNLGLSSKQLESFRTRLEELYIARLEHELAVSKGYRLCPGVPEILDVASEKGLLLGLCTGNLERGARLKLERGGISDYFGFGGFGEDGPARELVAKAAVSRALDRFDGVRPGIESVWIVGDTPLDVAAAKAAGVKALAVATGHCSMEELNSSGADLVLKDLAGAEQVLDRLEGFV